MEAYKKKIPHGLLFGGKSKKPHHNPILPVNRLLGSDDGGCGNSELAME
jgi:hypothetical protein